MHPRIVEYQISHSSIWYIAILRHSEWVCCSVGKNNYEHLRYKRLSVDSFWQSMSEIQEEAKLADSQEGTDENVTACSDDWDLHEELIVTKVNDNERNIVMTIL